MKIGIVGGGISGVSCAFWLSKRLKQEGFNSEIVLLEKNGKLGGSIDTVSKNGFTVEAGPNGFLDSKPHTLMLAEDAGLTGNLYRSNDAARKRFIMRNGKLIKLPEKPQEFFKSELLTLKGKMRVMMELLIRAKTDDEDETIADFATRRLGKEACDYLISPMVSGIFAGDPEKMSLKSCFPVIHNLEVEYGGLFKGMLKKKGKKSGPAGPGGVLTSYKGGLINFINDISTKFENVTIKTDESVILVKKNQAIFSVTTNKDTYQFDYLIVTAPAYESKNFLKQLSEPLAENISKINYAPAFVTGVGFLENDITNPLDGFGYLIPSKEKKKILGALFTSSIFPEGVEKGKKLVRVIMGGDKNRWITEKSEEELQNIAFNEIKDTLGIKDNPANFTSFYWEKAIPQYYMGHTKIAENIEKISAEAGKIFFGGNILYGVGINDCTRVSYEIVNRLVEFIKNK